MTSGSSMHRHSASTVKLACEAHDVNRKGDYIGSFFEKLWSSEWLKAPIYGPLWCSRTLHGGFIMLMPQILGCAGFFVAG